MLAAHHQRRIVEACDAEGVVHGRKEQRVRVAADVLVPLPREVAVPKRHAVRHLQRLPVLVGVKERAHAERVGDAHGQHRAKHARQRALLPLVLQAPLHLLWCSVPPTVRSFACSCLAVPAQGALLALLVCTLPESKGSAGSASNRQWAKDVPQPLAMLLLCWCFTCCVFCVCQTKAASTARAHRKSANAAQHVRLVVTDGSDD